MAESIVGDSAASPTTAYVPGTAPAVEGIEAEKGWHSWCYFGTREALAASGVMPKGLLFPG
jgi:hypothetical protein